MVEDMAVVAIILTGGYASRNMKVVWKLVSWRTALVAVAGKMASGAANGGYRNRHGHLKPFTGWLEPDAMYATLTKYRTADNPISLLPPAVPHIVNWSATLSCLYARLGTVWKLKAAVR